MENYRHLTTTPGKRREESTKIDSLNEVWVHLLRPSYGYPGYVKVVVTEVYMKHIKE